MDGTSHTDTEKVGANKGAGGGRITASENGRSRRCFRPHTDGRADLEEREMQGRRQETHTRVISPTQELLEHTYRGAARERSA